MCFVGYQINDTSKVIFCTDWQLIFSDKLADKVGRDMIKIAPGYDLFMKSEELTAREEKNS